jgi:hypothetical protein
VQTARPRIEISEHTELIRRKRIEELKQMMGNVDLELDVAASRRRPREVSARRRGRRRK